jgi:hypothetical protein
VSPGDELLIEQVASAFRSRDPFGRIQEHPAFADLAPDGREAAYALASELRRIEAALHPEGLSSTGQHVLALIRGERL